jgi:colanic acid/amylovoran biosynthesis protein
MRVLVQGGSYELDNLGDVSMVETLVGRVLAAQPRARVALFSRNQEQVSQISPDLELIPVESKGRWQLVHQGYLRVREMFPAIDRGLRRLPGVYGNLLHLKARQLVNRDELRNADLLLLSGGGYITDVFPGQAWSALERIEGALSEGIPFAMFGQGIGPLRDQALLRATRKLLPRAQLIAVREKLVSLPLLAAMGVDADRIVVTGDDSVEPAYRARLADLGSVIGVNVRVAGYAGMTSNDVDALRPPLFRAARELGVDLIPLPVCVVDSVESASDATIAARLLQEAGAVENKHEDLPTTVESLIARVGTCRAVVTGSYHAAVFALSQGIPAVCVFNCEYYETKFRGLEAQFGVGCEVLGKSARDFDSSLINAITAAWNNADLWRPALLEAARSQVDAGHAAYSQLWETMNLALSSPAIESRV